MAAWSASWARTLDVASAQRTNAASVPSWSRRPTTADTSRPRQTRKRCCVTRRDRMSSASCTSVSLSMPPTTTASPAQASPIQACCRHQTPRPRPRRHRRQQAHLQHSQCLGCRLPRRPRLCRLRDHLLCCRRQCPRPHRRQSRRFLLRYQRRRRSRLRRPYRPTHHRRPPRPNHQRCHSPRLLLHLRRRCRPMHHLCRRIHRLHRLFRRPSHSR